MLIQPQVAHKCITSVLSEIMTRVVIVEKNASPPPPPHQEFYSLYLCELEQITLMNANLKCFTSSEKIDTERSALRHSMCLTQSVPANRLTCPLAHTPSVWFVLPVDMHKPNSVSQSQPKERITRTA